MTPNFGEGEFGDFELDDTADELGYREVDWVKTRELQDKIDAINVLPDPKERKIAAKALVRELNGENSGSVLAT